jgi:hypothetical protein
MEAGAATLRVHWLIPIPDEGRGRRNRLERKPFGGVSGKTGKKSGLSFSEGQRRNSHHRELENVLNLA